MSWWSRLFGPKEQKYSTLDLFREIYGGPPSKTGISVNWASALEVSTVLACLRVIAEGIAQVPFKVYSDDGGNAGRVASDHPLYNVIYRRPNRWQTSFEFRETLAFHAALMGNAY
jgi:phage portal protein BeeE